MEKKTVILGIVAVESYLKGKFELDEKGLFKVATTAMIRDSFIKRQIGIGNIDIKEFSSDEMCDFIDFYYRNKLDKSIGFNEASALYSALIYNLMVIVLDKKTENICIDLGISVIKVTENTRYSISYAISDINQHVMSNSNTNFVQHYEDNMYKTISL